MARALSVVLVALALVATASAATLSSSDLRSAATIGWREVGIAPADAPVTVTLALTRSNDERMSAFVDRVSNPMDSKYTQYMTTEEIVSVIQPSAATMRAVTNWLTAARADYTVSRIGTTIDVQLTVIEASALFDTSFRSLVNDRTEQVAIVGDEVNVPDHLAQHIEAVFGVHGLPLPPRKQHKSVGAPLGEAVTPSVIRTAYNVSGITPTGSLTNRQAVVEFQGQLLSQSDLSQFFKTYVPNAKAGDDKVYKYVGDSQQGEGVEANLDIQYIMGVAPGIKTEAWQYAGQDFCTDLKTWTQAILAEKNPPNVFSVSYGWQGQLSQLGCSGSQVNSIDADFKSINAAGVTINFASGDSGSGYTSFFGLDPKLYPSWPASSKYVTAVGATTFIGNGPSSGEMAVTQFGSGGGFSRIVTPAPSWQTGPIAKFYMEEKNAPNKTYYGYGGRGTPDVAALGENFQVIVGGSDEPVGGTSAACPTFSAVISLINEARAQKGKGPLGNLNQFVYQNTGVFNDITKGNDRISRSGFPVPDGFDCEAGWDPVTGWGTPNFAKMLKAAMAV